MEQEKIKFLLKKYSEIIALEVEEFGCRPTEVRHLIGRMGEFFCAITVNGKLAHEPNQHGFDVVSESGRRISVKTTAQKSGFITINPSTLHKVDDLMLLQFKNGQLKIVYYGEISKAVGVARTWNGKYELDISKARSLS